VTELERQEKGSLQELDPESLLLAAELLGNLSSLQMPFNVQNLLGNWLQLLGQIILTFNAQQQLRQSGPGSCYSRCEQPGSSQTQTAQSHSQQAQLQAMQAEIAQLRQRLDQLERQTGQYR